MSDNMKKYRRLGKLNLEDKAVRFNIVKADCL